jgi:hypothetical protein
LYWGVTSAKQQQPFVDHLAIVNVVCGRHSGFTAAAAAAADYYPGVLLLLLLACTIMQEGQGPDLHLPECDA